MKQKFKIKSDYKVGDVVYSVNVFKGFLTRVEKFKIDKIQVDFHERFYDIENNEIEPEFRLRYYRKGYRFNYWKKEIFFNKEDILEIFKESLKSITDEAYYTDFIIRNDLRLSVYVKEESVIEDFRELPKMDITFELFEEMLQAVDDKFEEDETCN